MKIVENPWRTSCENKVRNSNAINEINSTDRIDALLLFSARRITSITANENINATINFSYVGFSSLKNKEIMPNNIGKPYSKGFSRNNVASVSEPLSVNILYTLK